MRGFFCFLSVADWVVILIGLVCLIILVKVYG